MRYESEMIKPLLYFLIDEFYLDAVEKEFSAGYGIADVVGVKYDRNKLKSRFESGLREPIVNIRELSLLNALQKNKYSTVESLAKQVGLSISYVKKVLLKSLREKGYVEKQQHKYILIRDICYFTDLVISIEAKLTKWRDALGQAKRYQHFSNLVFVALPRKTVKNIDRQLFIKSNVGVLSVTDDSVNIELKPQRMKPKTFTMYLYCNEFFLEKQKFLIY